MPLTECRLQVNRDRKEPGGLDRNSAFMVRWRVKPTRRKHALEHHSGVRRKPRFAGNREPMRRQWPMPGLIRQSPVLEP